jgi:hypothetical protein
MPGRRSPQIYVLSWRAYGAAARHSKTREAERTNTPPLGEPSGPLTASRAMV